MNNKNSNGAWFQSTCHITSSLWGKTSDPIPGLEVLREERKADVAVIGGGFCGLSSALHLAEHGYDVTLVDAHQPGWGASGRNGGQVIPGLKIMPDEMVARYGSERGERIAKTAGSAPSLVYDLIKKHNIECDLVRTGWIQLAKGPKGAETTNQHIEQWGSRGVDVSPLSATDIEEKVGTGAYHSGLLDQRGGNLHPLKYARGLARACIASGVSVFHESPAVSVERDAGNWLVKTVSGSIRAEIVVVCTNAYTGDMLPGLSDSIVPVLTGVMATGPLPESMQQAILPERQGVADTRRLLSWFGIDSAQRLIFGSRTNSQTESIDRENFTFGIQRLHEILPETKSLELKHMWTGRVALTLDHVPHIHRLADGLYSGLGFNGRGVAMASMFGKVLAGYCSGNMSEDEFLPVTPISKVPFNRFRGTGIVVALTWKRMMDTLHP